MSRVLAAVLRALPVGPLRTVERFVAAPMAVQEALLRRLLRRAARTEWGRRFGFEELARAPDVVAAYQQRVPLHGYEAIRDDVERVRRGVPDVLWPGTFRHFAVSSGTASSGKIIPVSEEMLRLNRRFSLASAFRYLAESGNARLLGGRLLSVPGRIEADPEYPGTLVGEVSGLQAEFAPAFVRYRYQAVPNEVLFLPAWEKKLDAIVERTVRMDVRAIAMVPSWAPVLFSRLLARYNALHGRQATTVGEVWPNLQVYFSGGVALRSYRSLLEARIGRPQVHFWEHYGASEGFFAFQYDLHGDDLLLHLDNGVFYEFVRMDDPSPEAPRRYTVAGVEPGVRYRMYVTTCSGLWAYGVGDVVRFTATDPPRIVVAGRTSEMLDTYGEAVFGEEARAALEAACARTGARVREFHVAPRPATVDRLPAHQWLVEFDVPPDDLTRFAGTLDAYLQRVNRHYQIRREPNAFDPPEVVPVPPGTFHAWLKASRPRVGAQTKVPRMSEERTVADGVLALVGNKPPGST
ncbi:GH3 auxin-responsive promoter family protein [Rhodocaloribacter litoris]|uniref:GH3 family domain-containing protein n=1 Tax=Rhodocaloribacter litoris TaxID=2558931 RepID=UPI001420FE0D|nr:GH3 auxin-responsive promoter family protein [Rhodocaloribacter litoris]QXD16505.1 GH3 auxin-responsive promoter family protein [Rhodocaloribacter litoris]GIV59474.1 MAG: GH3 auxin-responsive promoter superfamily protein [Rhodothermaceae bacterium]